MPTRTRKVKLPVTGIVTHVSRTGTEVHLANDTRRYRGRRVRYGETVYGLTCKTLPVFRYYGVRVGDSVTLHWGGFADMNIVSVDITRSPEREAKRLAAIAKYPELTRTSKYSRPTKGY